MDLPQEIAEKILVNLPVKSIIRFRSVCKSWFDLINSSRLIFKHLIESKASFLALCCIHYSERSESCFLDVFIYDYDDEEEEEEETSATRLNRFRKGMNKWINVFGDSQRLTAKYTLPLLNFELPLSCTFSSPLELVGSCNGILCLTNYQFILLVHPILKEVKTLPNPMPPPDMLHPNVISVKDCILVGFGFDDVNMDFKVVRILNSNGIDDGRQRAEVYNLKSNAWRKLNAFHYAVGERMNRSTFFDGVIYWCCAMTRHIGWGILAFNMASELFQLMEFPRSWSDDPFDNTLACPALFVLNQKSLAFVKYSDHSNNSADQLVNVWTMNKRGCKHGYGVTWTKLYSIGPLSEFQNPVGFPKKHTFLYYTTKGKLILYDLSNHRCNVVCDCTGIYRYNGNHDLEFWLKVNAEVCGSSSVSINM